MRSRACTGIHDGASAHIFSEVLDSIFGSLEFLSILLATPVSLFIAVTF